MVMMTVKTVTVVVLITILLIYCCKFLPLLDWTYNIQEVHCAKEGNHTVWSIIVTTTDRKAVNIMLSRLATRQSCSRKYARLLCAVGEDVKLSRSQGGIFAEITLNRPQVHNCLSPSVMDGLNNALDELKKDGENLRAVFLKAEGKTFCAGGDLKHMKATAQWTKEQNEEEAYNLSNVFNNIFTFPQPVIAMINGPAFGGGVGIVSACDMAFAVKTTAFALSEVTLGVIPATISPFVVSKIGATACRRYFVTAERFGAEEALQMGLINEIVVDQEALLAREESLKTSLLRCSPAAVRASKQLIASIEGKPINDELRRFTAARLAEVRDSPDGQEGMGAFLEKRKPKWTNV